MAWGTPTSLGSVTSAIGAQSLALTSVTAAAGTLVVVSGVVKATTGRTVSISDSAGNTWTIIQDFKGLGENCYGFIAWSYIANALSGGSITVSISGGTNWTSADFGAIGVTGAASSSTEDTAARATVNAVASTSPTITSGTPANAGDLFVVTYANPGTTTDTYTEDTGNGWTNTFAKIGVATSTFSQAYKVNAGVGTLVHNPTTTSRSYVQCVMAFKAAADAVDQPPDGEFSIEVVLDALDELENPVYLGDADNQANQDNAVDFLLGQPALPDEAEYVELALDWNDWSWAQAPPNDEATDFILGLEDDTNVDLDPSNTDLTEYGSADWLTPDDAIDALPSIEDATNVAEDPSSTDLGEYGDQTAPLSDNFEEVIFGTEDATNVGDDPSSTDLTEYGWVVDPLSIDSQDSVLGDEDDGSNDFEDPSLVDLTEYGWVSDPLSADVQDQILGIEFPEFEDPSLTDHTDFGWVFNPIIDDVADAILGAEDDGSNDFEEPSLTDLTDYGSQSDPLAPDVADFVLGVEDATNVSVDPSDTDLTDYGAQSDPLAPDATDAILGDEDDGSNDFEDPSQTDLTEYGDAQAPLSPDAADFLLGVDDDTASFDDPSQTDLTDYGTQSEPLAADAVDFILGIDDGTNLEDPSLTDFTDFGWTVDPLSDAAPVFEDFILGDDSDGSNDFPDPSQTDLTEYGEQTAPLAPDVFDFLLAATDDDTATFADPSQTDLSEYGWVIDPLSGDIADPIIGAEDDGSNDFEDPSLTDLTEYGWINDPLAPDSQDAILGIEFPEFEDPSLTDHTNFGWTIDPQNTDVQNFVLGIYGPDTEDDSFTDFTEYGDAQAPFPVTNVEDQLLGIDDGTADFADPSLTDLDEYGWISEPLSVPADDSVPSVYDANETSDPSYTDFTDYGWSDYLLEGLTCVYPVVAAFADGFATALPSYTVNLPAGTVAGSRIIVFISIDNDTGAPIFPAGWTQLWSAEHSPDMWFSGYYRDCDGSEGASITVSPATGSRNAAWDVLRIATFNTAQAPEVGVATNAKSAAPAPPPVTASWGADFNLFIAAVGAHNDTVTVFGYPANYTDNQNVAHGNGTITGEFVVRATRNLNAAGDTLSSFLLSATSSWVANTIVIRGLCVAPPQDVQLGTDDGFSAFADPSQTDFTEYGFYQDANYPDPVDALLGLDDDTSSFADPSQTDLTEYGWVSDPLSADFTPPEDALLGVDDGSGDFADPSLTDFTDYGSQAEAVMDAQEDRILGIDDSTNVFVDPSLTDLTEYGSYVDPLSPNAPPAQDFLLGIDDGTNVPDPSFTDLTEYGWTQAPAIPNFVPPPLVVPISEPCLRAYVMGPPPVSVCNLDTFEQTCDTIVQLRNLIGTAGLQVSVRGLYTVGDGQGGIYVWSPTQIGGDDGLNIVFPTAGASVGAWVRIGTFNTTGVALTFADPPAANPLGGYVFVGPDGALYYRGPNTTTLIGVP